MRQTIPFRVYTKSIIFIYFSFHFIRGDILRLDFSLWSKCVDFHWLFFRDNFLVLGQNESGNRAYPSSCRQMRFRHRGDASVRALSPRVCSVHFVTSVRHRMLIVCRQAPRHASMIIKNLFIYHSHSHTLSSRQSVYHLKPSRRVHKHVSILFASCFDRWARVWVSVRAET